jgi:hypothetical protein
MDGLGKTVHNFFLKNNNNYYYYFVQRSKLLRSTGVAGDQVVRGDPKPETKD